MKMMPLYLLLLVVGFQLMSVAAVNCNAIGMDLLSSKGLQIIRQYRNATASETVGQSSTNLATSYFIGNDKKITATALNMYKNLAGDNTVSDGCTAKQRLFCSHFMLSIQECNICSTL
jgi:hypothetical protein